MTTMPTPAEDFSAYARYLETVCGLDAPLKTLVLDGIYEKRFGIPLLESAEIRLKRNEVVCLAEAQKETWLDAAAIARKYQGADAAFINRILIIKGLQTARDNHTGQSVSLENIMQADMCLFVPTRLGREHGGKVLYGKDRKYQKCVWLKEPVLEWFDKLLIRKD